MVIFSVLICIILIAIISLAITKKAREPFEDALAHMRCSTYQDCKSCANASGCSWCQKDQVCLASVSLKATDPSCNQNNAINSSFSCQSFIDSSMPQTSQLDPQTDFALYKDQIRDRIPPPNVGISGKVEYSSADLTSNMNDIQNTIVNLNTNLPTIISSSVQDQIKPMVKGIIAERFTNSVQI